MWLHALTILVSAFLLFLVQPLIAKYILPWFGGSPGVWTTCLLFFQTLLLAGYAYAHILTTRLTPRRQMLVHFGLLALALAWLPIMPAAAWKPTGGEEPVARILLLLVASLGAPYLVLSATGPLLQRWFSLAHPGVPPYRLYALSNAGSLLALLGYPFLLEPLFARTELGWGWSAGFVVFAGVCGACAWRLRQADDRPAGVVAREETDRPVPGTDRLLWFVLPAISSLLLVAVTNRICLDIAAVPFLWVLPLAVYLLTFILCFDHPRWYSRRWCSALLAAGCGATAICLSSQTISLPVQVGVHTVTLLAACMVCHGEVYRLRPAASGLTGYYLAIAAGGAAGSIFVALLAPLLFADYRELELGLVLLMYFTGIICLLYRSRSLAIGTALGVLAGTWFVPALRADTSRDTGAWLHSWAHEIFVFYRENIPALGAGLAVVALALREGRRVGAGGWQRRMSAVPLALSVLLGAVFMRHAWQAGGTVLAAERNFYGAYKLHLYSENDLRGRFLLLSHGGITHGLQFAHPDYAGWATTYYGATSGVGRALDSLAGPRRIGLVGLGAGTLLTYGRAGDVFRFYEIDPAIVDLARTHFSYLRRTPATVEIALGDARLTLEEELRRGQNQGFDLLILDAFSGDAIPVHLLTREAMALYLAHLKPGGMIAVHISNRHLDLRPVVEGLARHHRLHFATLSDTVKEESWWIYTTTWMLLTTDDARLAVPDISNAAEEPPDDTARVVNWTDDHASLFEVLK